MLYSLAIATDDKPDDLFFGLKRKKQGDIIAVKPAGWQWGDKEVKEYLIVEVDLSMTQEEAEVSLIQQGDKGEKRRFQIPFSKLPVLSTEDLVKVKDPTIEFQPFKKVVIDGKLIQDKTKVI